MRSSLAIRLIVLMIICILPLAAVLIYNLYDLRHSQQRAVDDKAYNFGQMADLEMSRIIAGVTDTLQAIAASPTVRDLKPDECNIYMRSVTQALPQFAGIAIVDADGVIRCLQNPRGIGISLADRDYIRDSLASGKTKLGRFARGRISNEIVLPIAVPVLDEQAQPKGVVAGSISLKWLQDRLTERKFPTNSSLTVADADGTILARYPFPERFVGKAIADRYQSLIRAVAPGTIQLTSQDGTERILAYFPATNPNRSLYVSVGLSTEEEFAPISKALFWGWVAIIFAVVLATLLAWFAGNYAIRRPIQKLVATVDAWRQGRVEVRTHLGESAGEFGLVAQAIDNYMDELVEARARSEILMRELDHRVKNLLATVQVVTRHSLRAAKVAPDATRTLDARLGAMAKAHSILMGSRTNAADLHEIVQTSIELFQSDTRVRFQVEGPNLRIGANAALSFAMALHELATNAAKYGALKGDGTIEISWSLSDNNGTLRFCWRERGGPAVKVPDSTGFGSVMIEKMLADQLQGELTSTFAIEGLRLEFVVPVANLRD